MEYDLDGMDVLFVAGFGPITQSAAASRDFYVAALGLPLKPMPGNEEYLLTEHDALGGSNISPSGRWRRRRVPVLMPIAGQTICRCRRRGLSLKSAISARQPMR